MFHDSLPIVGALLHPSPWSGLADGFGYAVSWVLENVACLSSLCCWFRTSHDFISWCYCPPFKLSVWLQKCEQLWTILSKSMLLYLHDAMTSVLQSPLRPIPGLCCGRYISPTHLQPLDRCTWWVYGAAVGSCGEMEVVKWSEIGFGAWKLRGKLNIWVWRLIYFN